MSVNTSGSSGRELGAGLRALRERAGMTTRSVADAVGASSANVSNWERGERLPSEERLTQLLDAINASDDEREQLLTLRRQAEGPGRIAAGAPSIGRQLADLIEHEQVARQITAVAPLLVPGLLQTSDYARATLNGLRDIETRVALRMGRREVLTRTRGPVELHAMLDSEVLVRPIAPSSVMADQLRHLLRMADLPNVTIQLRASTASGYSPMLAGPFVLLRFAAASPLVHLEHHRASLTLWEDEDVRSFETAAEEIRGDAMTPARSAEVIAEIIKGMETT